MQSGIFRHCLRRILAGVLLAMIVAASAAADDYAKASQAYKTGQFATAIKLLEPLAKAGDPRAQHLLGSTHEWANSRDGVRRDVTRALLWYERAAKQGYLPAKRSLGRLLAADGIDAERGYKILLDLAKKGDVRAQTRLGAYLLRKGDRDLPKKYHLPGTPEEGLEWLHRAANSKSIGAAWHLRTWYLYNGIATEAYYWQIIVDTMGARTRMSIWPDIRDKLTKGRITTTERRAAVWLKARGYTYRRLDPPRR